MRYEHRTLRDADRGGEPVAAGGLANVVVEVRDAHGRVRRLTDGDGTARFTDLRPGTWTVELVEAALPDGVRLERDLYTVTVAGADTAALELRVLPVTQSMQMEQTSLGGAPRVGGSGAAGGVLRRAGASQTRKSRALRTGSAPVRNGRRDAEDRPMRVADEGSRSVAAERRHVVRADEWLAVLARRYYNNLHLWPRIWQANRDRLSNPDSIEVGTVLAIPEEASLTPEEAAARDGHLQVSNRPPAGDAPSARSHRVESVEWLAQLSRRYYGALACWPVIWNANREKIADPDLLEPGMHLTIPPRSTCGAAGE